MGTTRNLEARKCRNHNYYYLWNGRALGNDASEELGMQDQIEVIDLRTLFPLDEDTILKSVKKTGKCLVVTEEPSNNSFARALAGKIQEECFKHLDAPVMVIGSENIPAIPLNSILEQTMIPSTEKVKNKIEALLNYCLLYTSPSPRDS